AAAVSAPAALDDAARAGVAVGRVWRAVARVSAAAGAGGESLLGPAAAAAAAAEPAEPVPLPAAAAAAAATATATICPATAAPRQHDGRRTGRQQPVYALAHAHPVAVGAGSDS